MKNQPKLTETQDFHICSSLLTPTGSSSAAMTKPQRIAIATPDETHCVLRGGEEGGVVRVVIARLGGWPGVRHVTRHVTQTCLALFIFPAEDPSSGCEACMGCERICCARRGVTASGNGVALDGPGTGNKQKTYVDPENLDVPYVKREPFTWPHEARDFLLVGEVHVRVLIAPANLVEIHLVRLPCRRQRAGECKNKGGSRTTRRCALRSAREPWNYNCFVVPDLGL